MPAERADGNFTSENDGKFRQKRLQEPRANGLFELNSPRPDVPDAMTLTG
jgi:hypothetical protein